MKQLKLLFTVLFLAVLGLGNVWGAADYTLDATLDANKGKDNGYATAEDITVGDITWNVTGNATMAPWRIGGKNLSGVDRAVYSKTAYASAVSKIDLTVGAASSVTVNSLKLVYSTNADFSSSTEISGTFAVNSTISFAPASGDFPANAYYKFVFNVTIGSSNKFIEFKKVEFYNATSGGPEPTCSTPTITFAEESVAKLTTDAAFTNAATVEFNSVATGQAITYSVEDGKAGVATVNASTGEVTIVGVGSAKIYASVAADATYCEKSAYYTLTVTAPVVPTGTFSKYVGATLVEGDYLVCVGTDAMKNSVTSNRLDYASVTVTDNAVENPDAAVIWHIAPAATAGYVTMYNAAVEKYAASTGTKNQAGLLEDGTADKSLWSVSMPTIESYNFENKNNKANSVNACLQKNGTYGFACYAAYSNITLYLKDVISAVTVAPCTNGTVTVAGAADLSQVKAGATLTISNIPESGHELDELKVYKTGDETTKVTITDGKFTMPAYDVTVSATFKVGVQAPAFDKVSGKTFDGSAKILIDNYDDNFMYFYTTDGSNPAADAELNPTGTSVTYDKNEGIALTTPGTITVKAVAYTIDGDVSDITTATYTINQVYTSIAEFVAAAPATDKKLILDAADNAVIIGKNTKNLYLQDATGATIVLYHTTAVPNWTVGKRVEGTLVGKYSLYNNYHEMVLSDASKASADNDGTAIVPTVLTSLDDATFAANKGKLIKMENLYFQATSLTNNQVNAKNASDESYIMYNTFSALTGKILPDAEDAATVTGVFIAYVDKSNNVTYELAVTDIKAGDAKLNVSPLGGVDAENAVGIAMGGEVTVTPVAGFTTRVNDVAITEISTYAVTAPMSIIVEAERDFYEGVIEEYFYKVDDAVKAVTVTQPTVGGTISATPTSAAAGATITLSYEAAAHYTFAGFTVMNGETPVEVAENEDVYTFEMPNADVTVTASFTEDAKGTATFVAGAAEATGDVPAITKYVGETLTIPANTFALTANKFIGWKYNETIYQKGDEFTVTGDAEFVAQWEALPVWASTYTSTVTLAVNGQSNVYAENVKVDDVERTALRLSTGSNNGTAKITVPAGATALHFHAIAWKGDKTTLTVKNGEVTLMDAQELTAYDGLSGSTKPYTIVGDMTQEYYCINFVPALTEETTLDFISVKRCAIFGVNYVAPATVALDAASYDFESVKENATATHEFTITKNIFATGDIVVTFEGADAAAFSAGAVNAETGKFIVTFAPTEVRAYSATVKVTVNGAEATATLAGTGISATSPAIATDVETIDFGSVKQDATVEGKTVNVTLEYLDAATVAVTGSVFSIDKTALTESGAVVISANTAAMGTYTETLTIGGEGADSKTVTVKMEVISKYASEYTSNVKLTANTNTKAEGTKVIVDEINTEGYAALKMGTSNAPGSCIIKVPAGTERLHFHAVAWKSSTVGLVIKQGEAELATYNLYADDGVTGSSPFTLRGENYSSDQYFNYTFASQLTEDVELTFAPKTGGNRFVLYGVNAEGYVAKIGDKKYETLAEAFAAVGQGETINMVCNCSGNGIVVPSGSNFTVDFGGFTYTVNTDVLAGSNGTKNQCFQLLKNSTITFQNGTIVADNAAVKMIIQNYANLTLNNMVLDATEGTNSCSYVLSTNNGATNIVDTKITAKNGAVAFDVCGGWGGYESNAVTVSGLSVIAGKIEISQYNETAAESLTIAGGDFTAAEIVVDETNGGNKVEVTKTAEAEVEIPEGYKWNTENKLVLNIKEIRSDLEAGRMYTYCPAENVRAMAGAKFYQPENFDGFYVNLMEVSTLEAGYGYIMIAEAADAQGVFFGNAKTKAVDASAETRGMQGHLDEVASEPLTGHDYVFVKNNHLQYANNNYVTKGKAYLRLDIIKELTAEPENPAPRRRIGFAGNTATLLDEANGANAAEKMLINGQVMILRGGKFFDATGRLMK